jgi:signal transduction histidine kinase
LTIEASVHGVGEVQVPRLTLRQVLENLLLNAAEAVSAGGRARGVIAVSATLQAPAEDPHSGLLQIELRDDGIGIPAENLPRLFERGFSTKSRANNSGIGLHWCATVLSMLGGGLIADSAGTGHGARMRLSLPCLSRRRPYAARAA